MAKQRVYGFDEQGFQRVQEVVRRAYSSPRVGSQRRRQVPVLGGDGTTDSDEGYPPGNGTCPCNYCIEGVTIAGGTECCTDHLERPLQNPWFECADKDLTLEYITDDKWLTEEFDGPDCGGMHNVYRWLLTIDVDGISTLTLVLETDNGCDDVCITYWRSGYDCQCANTFELTKPHGKYIGVNRGYLSCKACVKPSLPLEQVYETVTGCDECFPTGVAPTVWSVEVPAGITNGSAGSTPCTGCDSLSGTFILSASNEAVWIAEVENILAAGTNCGFLAQGVGIGLYCTNGQLVLEFVFQSAIDPTQSYAVLSRYYGPSCTDPIVPGDTYEFTLDTDYLAFSPYCENWPDTVDVTPLSGLAVPDYPTSSGACVDASCTDTAAPTDPDAGCCCYVGDLFDYWDEADCTAFGGTWFADCGDADCSVDGACCTPINLCVEVNDIVCGLLGGTHHAGGDCATTDCDPPTGACCRANGTCDVTTEDDCMGTGETYQGDDTTCAGVNCLGSCCCYVSGSPNCCLQANVTEAACYALALDDCDAGAGTAVWVEGDTTCSTCGGSC